MLVGWDITGQCNLSCIYCYNRKYYEQHKSSDLDSTTIKAIFMDMINTETRVTYIQFLGGEPFFRKDMLDILHECDRHEIDFGIATNGTLLDNEKIERLCDLTHLKNVCFSIDSCYAKTANKMCGHDSWQKAVHNLAGLLDSRKKHTASFNVGIESVLTRYNTKHIDATIEWASSLGVDYWACDSLKKPFGLLTKTDITLLHSEVFDIGRKIALAAAELPGFDIRIDWGLPLFKSYINSIAGRDICGGVEKRCSAGSKSVWVGNTGCVQPCAYTNNFNEFRSDIVEGLNIKKMDLSLINLPFHDIIHSCYFKDFYRFAHTISAKRKYDLCSRCEFIDICEICPLDIMHYGERCTKSCLEFLRWRNQHG
jgi:MoaA/NifB/PqqE/SkfB family radical SAM enzyme